MSNELIDECEAIRQQAYAEADAKRSYAWEVISGVLILAGALVAVYLGVHQ